ncbi:MAG TPA: pepsin/retropepsin-like aspartic protease family protein [Xanthomonadales bacterium]|nr:pepsin/retropepsin-like aspartic protease family protein [Xanthomonadales bacterium]
MKNFILVPMLFVLAMPVMAFDEESDVSVIPFKLAGRLIIAEATVNGVSGNYLVDSGAPVIMLNKRFFTGGEVVTKPLNHPMPIGVGGAMTEVEAANDLTFSWGNIELLGQRALVADLSHLEKNVGETIVGLIGFETLQPFEIHFDYVRKELTLLRLDEHGTPLVTVKDSEPARVIEMGMVGHMPVIPVQIGGQELRMSIDSGAEGSMIMKRWQDQLDGEFEFLRTDVMRGADRNEQIGNVVRFDLMNLDGLNYENLTFRFNDIGGSQGHPMPIDGLLGYEFLAARPTAINFLARQVKLWPTRP